MIVLHDPDTLLHETVELLGAKVIPALESPSRIRKIVAAIEQSREHDVVQINHHEDSLNSLVQLIAKSHKKDYLQHLKDVFEQWRAAGLVEQDESVLPECFVFPNAARPAALQPPKDIYARAGYYAFDMSSGIMDKTYRSIIASANLAVEAVYRVHAKPEVRNAVALCRPPGHHCNGERAGGYCYVNNAAVAISAWKMKSDAPKAKAAVLDLDFHHGNGTQDIFYSDPSVLYTSIHGADEFPYYTGMADEAGEGEGVGANLNLPLEKGSSFDQYLEKLAIALPAIEKFQPEFLLVSLGFDTFHLDPLGCFKIYTEDYETMARTVRRRLPDVPAVILQEGGYAIEHLGSNMLSFLKGWEDKS